MTKEFIKKLAESRADCIFQPEYYKHVTDSWYLDEKFRFEGLQVGTEGRKPTKKEADIYMGYLVDLFEKYKDKWYGDVLAQDYYGKCIGFFKQIFDTIEIGNKTYSQFNIDEETIQKLKDLANIFVYKHNEFCK
ncbi:hypothetical protein IKN40_07075 [bacterium]|nr:hypothetical protein [bacterium]